MMYYRFSKLSKIAIISNMVFSAIMLVVFAFLFVKSLESMVIIDKYVEEHGVIREEAIEHLTEQGEQLYVGMLVGSYLGFMTNLAGLVTLMWYARTSSFLSGFISAGVCIFTNFIGGLVLFAVFFSKKREVKGSSEGYEGSTDMSKFIHRRLAEENKS